MSGNSFGERFRVTTFGESHGVALGAVLAAGGGFLHRLGLMLVAVLVPGVEEDGLVLIDAGPDHRARIHRQRCAVGLILAEALPGVAGPRAAQQRQQVILDDAVVELCAAAVGIRKAGEQDFHVPVGRAALRPHGTAGMRSLLAGGHAQDARGRVVAAETLPAGAQMGEVIGTGGRQREVTAILDIGNAAGNVTGATEAQAGLDVVGEVFLGALCARRTARAGRSLSTGAATIVLTGAASHHCGEQEPANDSGNVCLPHDVSPGPRIVIEQLMLLFCFVTFVTVAVNRTR